MKNTKALAAGGRRRRVRTHIKENSADRRGPLLASVLLATAAGSFSAQALAQGSPYPHTGRDLAASCAICHGTAGVSAAGMPTLAGQAKDYVVAQLRDFRDGKRPATVMHQIAKGLTAEEIEAVAAYWAAQKVK